MTNAAPIPFDTNIEPPIPPADLRAAFGKFATGVTVVTVNGPNGPVGITINSFSSLSLEPALVLWSLAKNSSRFAAFQNAQYCAIHVLSDEQKDICMDFTHNADTFSKISTTKNTQDVPLIDKCLARFECEKYDTFDGGDHVIFVSKVTDVSTHDANPLVFYDKTFRAITSQQ